MACTAPRSPARPSATWSAPDPSAQEAPFEIQGNYFQDPVRSRRVPWESGRVLLQGFVGVGYPKDVTLAEDGNTVEIDADELDNLPVLGGGAQLKLAGESFDFGVEGMFSISFRSDLQAFSVGGSGGVFVLDVDVQVYDVFGGPFLSIPLGERARLYGAAGPIVSFLEYSQEPEDGSSALDEDGSGVGAGVYARAGIEFLLPSGTLVGFGLRYSSSEVDLGSDIGDYEIEGVQFLITATRK